MSNDPTRRRRRRRRRTTTTTKWLLESRASTTCSRLKMASQEIASQELQDWNRRIFSRNFFIE
jgi:hypothetical protein